MASKRKSTTPCMVRASGTPESGDLVDCSAGKAPGAPEHDLGNSLAVTKDICEEDCEVIEGKSSPANPSRKPLGGYECKYCPFSTQNLNEFTEHIDMQHPNVILNPLYVCSECNFTTKKYDSLSEHNTKLHPGENNFKLKLIKLNNQTVLEQSIEVTGNPAVVETPDYEGVTGRIGNTNKATQIFHTGKPKGEAKKASDGIPPLLPDITEPITCINGAEILQDILAHVMPSVQLPPNINLVPKVPVPLNSTKYNSALDTNTTMISSFNKFPYPTQAELSWLTAASKHPEEQIRIWFATQRLKHGISWSPEEVEEARKKMFNGTIQPTHQTIAVLPAHVATGKMPQPLIQTAVPCQILSQTGLVLAQVSNGSTIPPITLAVAASQGQKRGVQNQLAVPEAKRLHVNPTEALPKQNMSAAPVSTATMPHSTVPPTSTSDRKKTKEQIAALKASFIVTQFPDDAEIYRLIEVTGLSRSEIKKWFSDYRYRSQRGISHITSESLAKDHLALSKARQDNHAYHPYPDFIFQQFKGKTHKQIAILEESFLKNSFPTHIELERLRTDARMTRREVESWFAERRKLRDNMEQAVLDSMGSSVKNKDPVASNGAANQTEKVAVSLPPTSSPKCSTAFAPSSQEQIRLLKNTFVRTQWPSPQEYDELAAQTGLTRTEIVRWFKENRSSLRTGTLKWLDQYQQQSVLDSCAETKGPKLPGPKNNHDELQLPNKEIQKVGKLSAESSEQSEGQVSQNSQAGEEKPNAGDINRVRLTLEDDAASSDCVESWNETEPKSKTDFDSESISGDNAHT